jgi:SAM-dependent methyltransferase
MDYWTEGKTRYGRVAETFGFWTPKGQKGTILDIGCSDGCTTRDILAYNPESFVVGCDINPLSIERAKRISLERYTSPEFIITDGYSPPFEKESFDVVFAMNNICFINRASNPDYDNTLRRIAELVKTGGLFFVSSSAQRIVLKREGAGFSLEDFRFNPKRTMLNEIIDLLVPNPPREYLDYCRCC